MSAANPKAAPAPKAAKRPQRSWTQLAWNSGGKTRAARQNASSEAERQEIMLGKGTGYSIFSTLIAGMIAYGGIGWVIGHFTHIGMLFPIGMLVGLAISLSWIIYRYGIKGGGQ